MKDEGSPKEKKKKYTDAFKRMVVREALNGASCVELAKKYDLPHFNTATGWKRHLRHRVDDMDTIQIAPLSKEDKKDLAAMKQRVQDLERSLSNANLKITGLEIMIDVAEKELGVNIRKKSGTKQSRS